VLFMGLTGLSACGLVPTSPDPLQASRTQPCARISWQDLGAARDINAAINKGDARPTRLAYGRGASPQAPDSGEMAEFDQLLRSERSIDLSMEIRRENEKAYVKGIEHWLQSHLAIEVRSCPG
jgi:hypothetical protein